MRALFAGRHAAAAAAAGFSHVHNTVNQQIFRPGIFKEFEEWIAHQMKRFVNKVIDGQEGQEGGVYNTTLLFYFKEYNSTAHLLHLCNLQREISISASQRIKYLKYLAKERC